MKKFFKLLFAFSLVFVFSFQDLKAQEEPTEDPEPVVVSKKITVAPVVSIKGSNNSLILTWNKVENATKYTIQRSTNKTKGFKTIATVTSNTYQNKSLKYGTTYYYKVIANGPENSKPSAVVGKKVVPNKVTNVKLTPYSNQIKITWKKTSNHGYFVYRSTDNKKWTKVATITKNSTVSYTNKKLSSNKVYYYQVKAYQKVGKTKVVGPSSGVFSIRTAPAAPSVSLTSLTIETIRLNLKPTSGAKKYQLYSYNEKTKKWELEWNVYPDEFINKIYNAYFYVNKSYHTYKYRVRACSATVCGSYKVVSGQAKLSKGVIESLRGENKAVNVLIEQTYGAKGYEVYRATSKTGKYTKVKTLSGVASVKFRDTKVSANKTYYYKVRSFMKIGKKTYYSSYSSIRAVKTGTNAGINSAYEDAKLVAKQWYFSKQTLITILTQEYKYSKTDATKGVEKCKFNYKANALKLAREMTQYSYTISEAGLRNSLINEFLYTESEADYAIANINFNWHQSLIDGITNDLNYGGGYSRSYLVEMYTDEYIGFTEEEVNQVITELNPDFNEQALKRLSTYLSWNEDATKQNAISELENYDFTEEEIEYAMEHITHNWSEGIISSYYSIEETNGEHNYYSKGQAIQILTSEGYGFSEEEVSEALDTLEIDFAQYALQNANKFIINAYNGVATPDNVRFYLTNVLFTEEEINYAIANINFNEMAIDYVIYTFDNSTFQFTRDNFIETLENAGFTHDNAVYAYDNLPEDYWYSFIERCVDNYIQSFNASNRGISRTSLINTIVSFYGFGEEEVTFVIDSSNINFNEQAMISASDLINSGHYSKLSLLEQLESYNYTESEIAYVGENNNFNFVNECIEVINDTFIGNPTEYTLEDITNQLINTYKFTEAEVNAAVEETNLASYFN